MKIKQRSERPLNISKEDLENAAVEELSEWFSVHRASVERWFINLVSQKNWRSGCLINSWKRLEWTDLICVVLCYPVTKISIFWKNWNM